MGWLEIGGELQQLHLSTRVQRIFYVATFDEKAQLIAFDKSNFYAADSHVRSMTGNVNIAGKEVGLVRTNLAGR